MSQGLELLLLFLVLPFLVAGAVIWYISWRSRDEPPPVRTSDVLATGDVGRAEILAVKSMGGFLDTRPMVRVDLRITMDGGDAPFDLQVTQSIPRYALRDVAEGNVTEVRVTPDRQHAAIVLASAE
jgi:hypothetical protein